MRLEVGDRVKTSYGTGPYVICEILRNCTCPAPLDEINMEDPPDSPAHIHLILKGRYYLGGYEEETLRSVWSDDYLIYCEQQGPVQTTFL